MFRKHTFWLKAVIAMQFLTGFLHSLSFLNNPEAANESERQMLDLMRNYKMDLGAGFQPTMNDLMNAFSISFALFLFFTAALNLYLLKNKLSSNILKGVVGINLIAYIICFITMSLLTFLPPIVCTGLIVLFLFLAFTTVRNKQTDN